MSKLNKKSTPYVDPRFSNERLAGETGALAAVQSNHALLERCVMANLLWENNAYQDGKEVSKEIDRLVPLCTPQFVVQLAVRSRVEQKLRHIGLYLIVRCLQSAWINNPVSGNLIADAIPKICTRADQVLDLVSLYWKLNPKRGNKNAPLANPLKKGIRACLNKYSEYAFAKYNRQTEVKFRDLIFLSHPVPVDEKRQDLFNRIINGQLATPDTWEVELSQSKDKKESWTRLVKDGKLGALASLRNIRNMVDAGVNHNVIKLAISKVDGTMLLPLNYISAARENPYFSRDIEESMLEAWKNLPKLKGRTLFIVDVSGSMSAKISDKSTFNRLDCAAAMCMLAVNMCESYEVVKTAGSDSRRIHRTEVLPIPMRGFGLIDQIKRDQLGGGGIFTAQCLDWCKENIEGDFDRVIVFSDSQDIDEGTRIPKPFGNYNYIVDVSSHTRGINYEGVWTAEISGWSEHFLTFIASLEGQKNSFTDDSEQ